MHLSLQWEIFLLKMSKLFLFIPFLLFAMKSNYWRIDDTIYLKKDYPAIYKIYYNNQTYTLKFRWTLYKNDGIVMFYDYENHPYQNILYTTTQTNGFKKFISSIVDSPKAPYFLIYFRNFSGNIAKFEFLIYNPKKNIRININEPRYRNKKWVSKLKPLYQKQFEREIDGKNLQ